MEEESDPEDKAEQYNEPPPTTNDGKDGFERLSQRDEENNQDDEEEQLLQQDRKPPYSSIAPQKLFCGLMVLSFIVPAILLTRRGDLQIFLSEEQITDELWFQFSIYMTLMIPFLFFIQWALASVGQGAYYIFGRASYVDVDDNQDGPKWWILMIPTRTTLMFHVCLVGSFVKLAVVPLVNPPLRDLFTSYVDFTIAIFLFLGWIFALEEAHHALHRYAQSVDEFVDKNQKSKKWLNIMKTVGSFRKPEVDKAYRNTGFARSPAHALAGASGLYVVIGKFLGMTLLLFYMLDFDLYERIFVFGLTAAVILAQNAMAVNSSFRTLASLTMSNTIHAGEIVALSGSGSSPGHDPGGSVVGFVEGFTWSHIVIRDFKKFQVFIPYQELQNLSITNWSRRPAKLVNIELCVQPSLSGGAARLAKLLDFVKEWMQRHPDLDQDEYTKAILKHNSKDGPTMLVMFYNRVGGDRNRLRNEFVVMMMDAAQRLDLCLTPAEQRPTSNWPQEEEKSADIGGEEIERHLFHLLPSDELTARSGYAAKFKHL